MVFFLAEGCASQKSKILKKKQQDVLESYRLQVSETVEEPERAEKLITLGKDLYQQLRQDTKVLQKLFDNLETLNKNYDTEREELQAAYLAINNHRQKMRETILTARINALQLTTTEEWQELMSRRRTLMDFIQESPGFL